ncbi:MAG TPA: zinc metalloprotease [Thermoleophilaceae bacterium]
MSPTQPPRRRTCAHMIVHELLVETQPEYRERRLAAEEQTRESIDSGEAMRVARRLIKLPVVVHVVHRAAEENISDAQIKSQLAVLNRDFRAKNPDKSKVPPVWKSLVMDSNIEFALATKDPKGKQTTGITRTATTAEGFGPDNTVKSRRTGGVNAWPADRYLNVWVCNLTDGLLGYAQFPGGPARTDGVVILYSAFGSQGTVRPPFNKGRTTTHEVGHFLGLRHIWGDRNDCSGNDFVADTPPARAANTGKPKFPHVTCNNGPSGDMFINYMDYVDDTAMFMFTAGQVARMNATLAGPRKKLAGL